MGCKRKVGTTDFTALTRPADTLSPLRGEGQGEGLPVGLSIRVIRVIRGWLLRRFHDVAHRRCCSRHPSSRPEAVPGRSQDQSSYYYNGIRSGRARFRKNLRKFSLLLRKRRENLSGNPFDPPNTRTDAKRKSIAIVGECASDSRSDGVTAPLLACLAGIAGC